MAHLPMNIENVNIVRPQLPQALPDGDVHAFRRVSCVVALHEQMLSIIKLISSRVLDGDNHLVPDVALLHPFLNEKLRFLIMVRVGGVDGIAAYIELRIEYIKWCFVLAKYGRPGTANADAAGGERRYFHCCCRSQGAVQSQRRARLRGGTKERHDAEVYSRVLHNYGSQGVPINLEYL